MALSEDSTAGVSWLQSDFVYQELSLYPYGFILKFTHKKTLTNAKFGNCKRVQTLLTSVSLPKRSQLSNVTPTRHPQLGGISPRKEPQFIASPLHEEHRLRIAPQPWQSGSFRPQSRPLAAAARRRLRVGPCRRFGEGHRSGRLAGQCTPG